MTRENLDKLIDYLESELCYRKKEARRYKKRMSKKDNYYNDYYYDMGKISNIEEMLHLINYLNDNE